MSQEKGLARYMKITEKDTKVNKLSYKVLLNSLQLRYIYKVLHIGVYWPTKDAPDKPVFALSGTIDLRRPEG